MIHLRRYFFGLVGAACLLSLSSPAPAQNLLGQLANELTETSVTGTIVSLNRNGRIQVKTENGIRQIEPIPPGFNLGLSISVSVTGTEKPSWLQKGLPIFVKGRINNQNKFVEPVDEIFVFSPDAATIWGFDEEVEEAEDGSKAASLSAIIVGIKKNQLITKYRPSPRIVRRVIIPIKDDTRVQINTADLTLARVGDSITATGYVVREPVMMALSINIARKSTADNNAKGKNDGKAAKGNDDPNRAKGKPAAGGKPVAGDGKTPATGKNVDNPPQNMTPEGNGNQADGETADPADGVKKSATIPNTAKETPKRRRHRPGRAIRINR